MTRLSLLAFGLLSIAVGAVSAATGILLFLMGFVVSMPAGVTTRLLMEVFLFVLGEVFLMFGIAAVLLGARCALGPRPWITKAIDYTWGRAVWFAIAMPLVGMAMGLLIAGVRFLISLF